VNENLHQVGGIRSHADRGSKSFRDVVGKEMKMSKISIVLAAIFSEENTDAIIQDPPDNVQSAYFEFDGGYKSTTLIKPGKAYWVKAKQTGQLILNTP
jgi:hypothetical protein